MNTKTTITWIVKIIAVLLGLLGVFMIYMFTSLLFAELNNNEQPMLALTAFIVLLGSIHIWVAYDVLRYYSLRSIKSLSTLIALISFGQLSNYAMQNMQEYMDNDNVEMIIITGFAPLIIMLVAYKILVFIITRYSLDTQSN